MSLFDSAMAPIHNGLLVAFGDEITYTPDGGDAETITGILDSGDDFEERTPGAQHSLWVVLADFTVEPSKGDAVVVDSADYRIIAVRKDGDGGAYLDLQLIRA